jgi:hypothetical protein
MIKLLAVATVVSAFALAACGDDTGSSATGTGGGGGAGGSTTAQGGAGGSGGAGGATTSQGGAGGGGVDCVAVCGALYDCGVENMNCMGFSGDPAEKQLFIDGSNMDGCASTCASQPFLADLVDPNDCAGTISTLKGASGDFAAVCDGGFSTGTGGAGGAP